MNVDIGRAHEYLPGRVELVETSASPSFRVFLVSAWRLDITKLVKCQSG